MAPERSTDGGRFFYQLVIRIFKGRMFPPTHEEGGRHIALEARFNGENLATDPVPLCAEPTFNTELVWEFGAAKHREIKDREGSTLRLSCALAGEEMAQTGAKLVGFVMLDLRPYASATVMPTIGATSGRSGAAAAALSAKEQSRWFQLRGAKQPMPEIKIFVKINCKPIVSLVSGPPMADDFGSQGRSGHRPPIKAIQREDANDESRQHGEMSGIHGTVLLPPQRQPAGCKREPGAWGRYSLAVRCKGLSQDQVGVRSTVPLEANWSLLVGIAGRMYAIHAPSIQSSALTPGLPGAEPGVVHELLIADASSLVDFLERSEGRGGGLAIWLFLDGKQIACGSLGLGQLAGVVGRKWKQGHIGNMAASAVLLNTWLPSRLDDSGGSGPGIDAEADGSGRSVATVELDVDLHGVGSGPERPVPVPEFEQQVPCSLAITIVSLCLIGEPLRVESLKIECRKGSVRRLGEAEHAALHTTQQLYLDAGDGVDSVEGQHFGIGEMFTMAGAWGDLRSVVLEFDLSHDDESRLQTLRPEERLLGAGMIDVGAAICSGHGKDDLRGVAGAMRVHTVPIVDQRGRALGRLSVMLACNLSLDFPQDDLLANSEGMAAAEERVMIHKAQRAALVCEAAPEGDVDVHRDMALAIDLQAIRALSNSNDSIYIRYSLPTLGYLPPVLTATAETSRHGVQALQSNSYNSYEVALSYRTLAAALATPIQLEVWAKEKYAKDKLIAVGDLHLWLPFAALSDSHEEHPPAQRNWPTQKREWSGVVTAYQVDEASARLAEKLGVGATEIVVTKRKLFAISVCLTFDDRGPVNDEPSADEEAARKDCNAAGARANDTLPACFTRSDPVEEREPEGAGRSLASVAAEQRSVEERGAASQEMNGEDSVVVGKGEGMGARLGDGARVAPDRDEGSIGRGGVGRVPEHPHSDDMRIRKREEALMAALEQEFRRQEEHRERAVARKLQEVAALEAALKTSLTEMERRERRLELAEEEAQGRRRQEHAQLEQQRSQLQEARKRMREEVGHELSMAEARRNEALQQLQEQTARFKESEERNARLDAEVHKLRASQRNTSEASLMVEVASLKAKNEELIQRLHKSEEQHVVCKEQLARALTRLSQIRDEEHQREVESMKILLQARSESEEISQEREELDQLKEQLQALKGHAAGGGGPGRTDSIGIGVAGSQQRVRGVDASRGGGRQSMLAFESIPEGGDDDEEGQSGYSGGGYTGNGCLSQGASRHEPDRSPSEQASSWGWMPVEGEEEEKGGAATEAGEASSAGGRAPLFGGDTPEKRRPTTEKEQQLLAQLNEEHLRLRDERDALLRTEVYGPEDEVILEIQRHMWQVSREISGVGVAWCE